MLNLPRSRPSCELLSCARPPAYARSSLLLQHAAAPPAYGSATGPEEALVSRVLQPSAASQFRDKLALKLEFVPGVSPQMLALVKRDEFAVRPNVKASPLWRTDACEPAASNLI